MVEILKVPTQHLACKTSTAKIAMLSNSNTPKRMESQDKNQELQLIGSRRLKISLIKGSQSDTSIDLNLPNLDIRFCIKKHDYAFVATLKLIKSSKQPLTKVSYGTCRPKGK